MHKKSNNNAGSSDFREETFELFNYGSSFYAPFRNLEYKSLSTEKIFS